MPRHFYAICPLCQQVGTLFYPKNHYFQCIECDGVFRDSDTYLCASQEKSYYTNTHQYHHDDVGYRQFVQPLIDLILQRQNKKDHGLDFGCGATPILSTWLQQQGCNIIGYDPFFASDQTPLKQSYDYIICCEVAEHFHYPKQAFQQLRDLLKEGGRLYCMTWRYHSDINFARWYYKNDPTHVFIYQDATMRYIQREMDFSRVTLLERIAIFTK